MAAAETFSVVSMVDGRLVDTWAAFLLLLFNMAIWLRRLKALRIEKVELVEEDEEDKAELVDRDGVRGALEMLVLVCWLLWIGVVAPVEVALDGVWLT